MFTAVFTKALHCVIVVPVQAFINYSLIRFINDAYAECYQKMKSVKKPV
jgi:hypothetical protein